MNVSDVMIREVACCGPNTNLADAAWAMWQKDCGILPILEGDKVTGVITDRDIAIAAGTNGRSVREILVREVVSRRAKSVRPDEELGAALDLMAREQVRRLPVADSEGRLQGILSLNDIVLTAESFRKGNSGIAYEDVMSALKRISRHREELERSPAARNRVPVRTG